MVADGILSWLTFAGIPHAAIDTDVQHHTLSDRYKMHLLDATSSEDEFEQLLENLPESPTLIVDSLATRHRRFWSLPTTSKCSIPFGRPVSGPRS